MHYGAFALFFLLALGIIALPIPDETLMVVSGILMFDGHLCPVPTIVAAIAGCISGITVSYLMGRALGKYFIKRHGGWIGLTPEKVNLVHDWFRRFGKWTLFFGYFVPGIRHVTGLLAGSIALEFELFALFAYCGAFLWSLTFLSLGYFFGNYLISFFEGFEVNLDEIFLMVAFLCLIYYLIRIVTGSDKKGSP